MQELPLVAQVEKWVRSLPPEESMDLLANLERKLRASSLLTDREFIQAITAWRLRQQILF